MAQVAITGLSLANLSKTHWVARSFFLASLLSGCISVYYAMHQLRLLGRLVTRDKIIEWLRAPPQLVRCEDKNQPSLRAVLVLDTPRWLVDMAAVTFIVGLSVYTVLVYVNDLDTEAGSKDSRNVVIAYFFTLPFCMLLFSKAALFDYSTSPDRSWNAGFFWDKLEGIWRAIIGKFPSEEQDLEFQQPSPAQGQPVLPDIAAQVNETDVEHKEHMGPTMTIDESLVGLLQTVVESRRRAAEADERLAKAFEQLTESIIASSRV